VPAVPERSTRRRLDQPSAAGKRFRVDVDVEAFGRLAERLARFLGTGTYLFWQTLFVIVWVVLNIVGIVGQWDPYPFILLNLAFSTQAAYAAPLILLAQNRQDDRDRVSLDEDRSRAARTSAETEYLARELAAVRLALGDVVTRDFLRGELERGTGAERADRGGGVERETAKAIGKAVDRSVDRAVSRAVDRIVEQAVETAVERALARVGAEDHRSNGRDRPGEAQPHT
jgi:uncharacterized membrane protein